MKTQRSLCAAGVVLLLAACGGSGSGDVTIATDDPPPGSPSHAGQVDATAGTDRALPMAGKHALPGQ